MSKDTYYRVVSRSTSPRRLHTDPDCPHLEGCDVREVCADSVPNDELCKRCTGREMPRNRPQGTPLAVKLEHADSLEELQEGSA
jgi:hypothetical protein